MYSTQAHTHTDTLIFNTSIHMHMPGRTYQHRKNPQHSHKYNQGKEPHPPAHQDEGLLVGNIYKYICAVWILPAAGIRHSVCPVPAPRSQSPQLLAPGHGSP